MKGTEGSKSRTVALHLHGIKSVHSGSLTFQTCLSVLRSKPESCWRMFKSWPLDRHGSKRFSSKCIPNAEARLRAQRTSNKELQYTLIISLNQPRTSARWNQPQSWGWFRAHGPAVHQGLPALLGFWTPSAKLGGTPRESRSHLRPGFSHRPDPVLHDGWGRSLASTSLVHQVQ